MAVFNKGKEKEKHEKKKRMYIYIAIDKNNNKPIIKKGDLVFSYQIAEDEDPIKSTQWPFVKDRKKGGSKEFPSEWTVSKEYRIELIIDDNQSKEEAKNNAKQELRIKCQHFIDEAKVTEKKDEKSPIPENEERIGEKTSITPETTVGDLSDNAKGVVDKNSSSEIPPEKEEVKNQGSVETANSEDKRTLIKNEIESESSFDDNDQDKEVPVDLANIKEEIQILEKDIEFITDKIEEKSRSTEKHIKELCARLDERFPGLERSLERPIITQGNYIKEISINQQSIAKIAKSNAEMIKDITERTETFEGKIKKLDQIEEIVQLLEDKGLEIRKTAVPGSREEEDILNMSKYAVAIIDQLTIASCELIKKKAAFEQNDKGKNNLEMQYEEKYQEAKMTGMQEGKIDLITRILDKIEDVDTLIDSDNIVNKIMWSTFTEQGLEIDAFGKYKKGEIVTVGNEEAEIMAAKFKGIEGAGEYLVTKTGLAFNGKTVFAAEFAKNERG